MSHFLKVSLSLQEDTIMQILPSRFQVLLLLFTGCVLVMSSMDSMWSHSVDLAHHYALAFRIAEQWHLDSPDDPTLEEMNFYPNLSHTFAAILGFVVNSTFMGVQLVALLSLALLWAGILYVINTLPSRLALLSSVVLLLLLILNKKFLGLNVHGAELIVNFFFPQIVAQAVIFTGISIAIYLELKKGRSQAYIFLALLIAINTSVHLLPTLELLGLLVGLTVLNNFLDHESSRDQVKTVFLPVAVILAALSGVIFNPAFSAMRKMAEHDGGLDLNHIAYPNGLLLLCLLSLIAAFFLLYFWKKHRENHGYTAIKYIALYGSSIASLCLLQTMLAKYGFWSNYAAKKYGFGLITYLFICLSVVFAMIVANAFNHLSIGAMTKSHYFRSSILLLSYCGIFLSSVPSQKSLDTLKVISLERQLIRLRDVSLPPASKSKSNVVIDLDKMPATINYMFSIAVTKTPREISTPDVFFKNELSDLNKYSSIVSSRITRRYNSPNCKSYSTSSITISDAACIKAVLEELSVCKGSFDFSSNGYINPSLIRGFSGPEDHGRWTDGKTAQFACIIKGNPPKKIKISATPFIYGAHKRQRLVVLVNGEPAGNFDFTNTHGVAQIEVQLPAAHGRDEYFISFETPDAISAKEVGLSQDGRQLGFSVKAISFE